MVRLLLPAVEVTAPDGTKSLWVAATPYREAVAAVRRVIPKDHWAELSVRRPLRNPLGLRPGEIRLMEV
jgi:hypothetical protein